MSLVAEFLKRPHADPQDSGSTESEFNPHNHLKCCDYLSVTRNNQHVVFIGSGFDSPQATPPQQLIYRLTRRLSPNRPYPLNADVDSRQYLQTFAQEPKIL
jgi:hypothetical protein